MSESKTKTTDPIVFVVDDDDAMRDAVSALMHSAGIACRTYPSAQAFLDAFTSVEPDVGGCLVLDIRMPGMDGLELQDALTQIGVDLPIVFISRYGDIPTAVRAMKGGATDFLSLPAEAKVLRDRIASALDADVKRRERRRQLAELQTRTATLSPRESEVFERVATGQANKAIAIDLGISERTVEIHRSRVMKKMMANNLAELVRMKIALDARWEPVIDL
ncbi:MAG: response regulator [Gammaproteobacteria bacterium]|nr:response regulator [Gammaproteobacteria bacterium]